MSDLVEHTEILPPATLFGTDDPGAILQRQTELARTLADVVRQQQLVVRIGQSEHVRVEGWTFLGSLLGVFPVVEWTRPVMDGDAKIGWEARVEARTRNGEIVGSGEAECLRSERTWSSRDDYALRSMAQTRAVSKALRMPLGFVMQLAGFNPTPAEEMPVVEGRAAAGEEDRLFPPVDENGEIIPAGSAAADRSVLTEAQAKKLNVMVAKLREQGHITTEQLWRAMGQEPVMGDDGAVHWSPLRDSLSRDQAHELIDRLEALEERLRETEGAAA